MSTNPDSHILIVDDVNAMRVQIREILKANGFKNVTLAEGAIEAQMALEGTQVDLMLVDWHMEPTNGMDLLRFVRNDNRYKHIPFVMLTGENRKENVVEALRLGANGYLLKPVTSQQLIPKVASLLKISDGLMKPGQHVINQRLMVKFFDEIGGFAKVAENILDVVEKDMVGNRKLFTVFSERILALRSTAQQLGLDNIVQIAYLVEEIASRASASENRAELRRAVGSIWDALTTMKFLIENYTSKETTAEQAILIRRLEHNLKLLGGPRETVSTDEIEDFLKKLGN